MKSKNINSYQILGCKVSDCTTDQLNDYILSSIQQNKKEMVLNVNINCINLAQKNQWLKDQYGYYKDHVLYTIKNNIDPKVNKWYKLKNDNLVTVNSKVNMATSRTLGKK